MENIIVLKNVGNNVTTMANLNTMVAGEFVAIGDGKVILTGVAGELLDIKRVQFATRRDDGTIKMSVPILRRAVKNVTNQDYVAPVVGVFQIGSTSAGLGLPITDASEGEVNIAVQNLSYNHAVATQSLRFNFTKKATETADVFVTRVVDALNQTNPTVATKYIPKFYTAAKIASGANFGITFTMNNANIDFNLVMDGLFAGVPVTNPTPAVPGVGVGTDVRAMEVDYSRNEGNSGSYILPADWFKGTPDAVAAGTYAISTIHWLAEHTDPTTIRFGNSNTLAIAWPSAATAVATRVKAILSAAFGDAWTGDIGNNAEPGGADPDTNAVSGTVVLGPDPTP